MVTLRGRVIEKWTGRPLEGILVTADGVTAITNANGMFEMVLEVGTYTINAMHRDYETFTETMSLAADTEVEIELVPIFEALR